MDTPSGTYTFPRWSCLGPRISHVFGFRVRRPHTLTSLFSASPSFVPMAPFCWVTRARLSVNHSLCFCPLSLGDTPFVPAFPPGVSHAGSQVSSPNTSISFSPSFHVASALYRALNRARIIYGKKLFMKSCLWISWSRKIFIRLDLTTANLTTTDLCLPTVSDEFTLLASNIHFVVILAFRGTTV